MTPRADIAITGTLDGLLVTPRRKDDRAAIKTLISEVIGNEKLRIRVDGFVVSSEGAAELLARADSPDFAWAEEARRYALNRKGAITSHFVAHKRISELKVGGPSHARRVLVDLEGIEHLDEHQLVNVAAMTIPDTVGLCVFDEQGAGKTVSFIFAFDLLVHRDQADVALIISPKSMVSEWKRDIRRFKGDLYKVSQLTGSRSDKIQALRSGGDIFVTNFETPVTMEAELRAFLRHHGNRAVIAVDESFFIKNPDAQRSRSARRLREWCGRAYVLCGTPAPNSPKDIVEQFNFVDLGITFGGIEIPEDDEAAVEVVRKRIDKAGLYVRHLKHEVLPDLPGKTFRPLFVPLEGSQEKIYRSILLDLIEELQRSDDLYFRKNITSFLAKRSALLQVCSNPTSVVPTYSEIPAKLLALDSLLEELIISKGEKVVVWSFYTASIEAILARYSRFNPIRYDGKVTEVAVRSDAVHRFQSDSESMLFVGNPAAAGAGITLHRAKYAIYESFSNQAAHYLQSLDRIHRRGQTRSVEYIILLAARTIEVGEFERLLVKERSAQDLLGDRVMPAITKEAMLSEAIHAAEVLDAD